jgi:hypothetical protein
VIGLVHSGKGSSLAAGYGYLTGHPVSDGLGGLLSILGAIVIHPAQPLRVLGQRFSDLFQYVAGAGLVGLASPLGLAAVVVVLLPNGLNQTGIYVSHVGGFQNFFVAMLVALGAVQVLTWLARRPWHGVWLSGAVGAVALVVAAVTSVQVVTGDPIGIRAQFVTVGAPTADELATVAARIPTGNEVIVSNGVAGRFGARRWVYFFFTDSTGQQVPVHGTTVDVVVVPRQGGSPAASVASAMRAAAYLRDRGAHVIADRNGVEAFAWTPPRGTRSVTFP